MMSCLIFKSYNNKKESSNGDKIGNGIGDGQEMMFDDGVGHVVSDSDGVGVDRRCNWI